MLQCIFLSQVVKAQAPRVSMTIFLTGGLWGKCPRLATTPLISQPKQQAEGP